MGRARQIASAENMDRILLDASAASTDEGVWTSCYESGSASTPSTEDKLDDNTNSISSCVNVSFTL